LRQKNFQSAEVGRERSLVPFEYAIDYKCCLFINFRISRVLDKELQ